MSMPSDVTEDVTEAMERSAPAVPVEPSHGLLRDVTLQQAGLAAAAFVAFLGVAVLGPRIAAMRRPKKLGLKAKAQRTAQDARRRASSAGAKAQKRLRQLGGGTIRL